MGVGVRTLSSSFIEELSVQKHATFKIPPESSRELLEANIIHTEEENFVGNLAFFFHFASILFCVKSKLLLL